MLSREERILSEILVARQLVPSETLERRLRQHADSGSDTRLVDLLVGSGDLDERVGREVADEAHELERVMAPELDPGSQLGEFRLVGEIGRGGMGVVYEAEQESLGRRVALKVLHAGAAIDETVVIRFLREARAAGRLHHPGIVPVFASGQADGVLFFAMERVHGCSLADRIAQGALPPAEAARITCEIARALAHAHEAGLVHRDVKPENILIEPDGRARITDFGLVHEARAGSVTLSHFLLGTPSYAAPEQARGEKVDPRTDVYGLGAVLYTMLAGAPPYGGNVPAAVLAQLITRDPPELASRAPAAPAALVAICRRAMARDREARYESAHALADDLERFLRGEATPLARAPRSRAPGWKGVAAFTGVALLAAAILLYVRRPTGDVKPRAPGARSGVLAGRYRTIDLPPGSKSFPALSPDGSVLVYDSDVGGDWHLFAVALDGTSAPTDLTATLPGNHSQPAFSPDGNRLAFASRGAGPAEQRSLPASRLFVMDLAGGDATYLARGAQPSWSPSGREIAVVEKSAPRYLGLQPSSKLWAVDVESHERRLLTGIGATSPSWSPNGQRIAFVSRNGGWSDVWTVGARGGGPVRLTNDPDADWSPVWSPDGGLLYFGSQRSGRPDLWRIAVDEKTGEPRGDAEPVTRALAAASFYLATARSGDRLVLLQRADAEALFALEPDGSAPPVSRMPDFLEPVRFAHADPSTGALLFSSTTGAGESLLRLEPGAQRPVTVLQGPFTIRAPRASPDGSRIAFHSSRGGGTEIWTARADGSSPERVTDTPDGEARFAVWSPEGDRLAYTVSGRGAFVIGLERGGEPQPLPPPPGGEIFEPWSWSSDGRELAGSSRGVLLYSFAAGEYRRLSESGERPTWIEGTRDLLFVDGQRILRMDGRTGESRVIVSAAPNRLLPALTLAPDRRTVYFSLAGSDETPLLLELGP